MKITIELFRGTLNLRFYVDRKTYRYSTGVKLTEQQWKDEKRRGFKVAIPASEMAEQASKVMNLIDHFSFDEFKRLMDMDVSSANPIIVWFERFIQYKKQHNRSVTTIEALGVILNHIRAFIKANDKYVDTLAWDSATLNMFNSFIGKSPGNQEDVLRSPEIIFQLDA
jgi:hypothetical protein